MASKYYSFHVFMDEVVQTANRQFELDTLFALDSKFLKQVSEILGVTVRLINAFYQKKELPIAVREVGEEFKPRWKEVEGYVDEIEALQQRAVNSLVKKASSKQIKLFDSIENWKSEDIFDFKCYQLLDLLDSAEEVIDKLDKSSHFFFNSEDLRKQISKTRQRYNKGLFSIALIGEFQSGKSTTLNAFADGREIAPRGLGIVTSACLVKVRNPNQGEKETAKITWRTHKDLLLRLNEILGKTACQIPDLEQALREDLKNYAESGQQRSEDRLKALQFAMIILAYHDDPVLQNLQKQTDFQPEEIQDYLKFPKEFRKRWNKCFGNFKKNLVKIEFELSEVMYAFIEEVTYIVSSGNLRTLGAEIIDCPSLFFSRYDTLIALKAMQESSAILYLLSIDKQLPDWEIQNLNAIKDSGHLNKVFFVLNYKDNPDIRNEVISTILKQLKNLGFTNSYQTNLLYFNAFLALRAMQGEKLLDNNLDAYSQGQIKLDTEAMLNEEIESVEQAWLDSVEEVLSVVVTKSRRKEILSSGFTERTVELVKYESKWDNLTDQIKQYVFKTKSWSVLVGSGCEPVINTLEKMEASLKLAEDQVQRQSREAAENLISPFLQLFDDLGLDNLDAVSKARQAKNIYQETEKEGKKIIEAVRDLRKNWAEPLRQELQRFQASVEQIWKKPS